jgi:hypothetical protein
MTEGLRVLPSYRTWARIEWHQDLLIRIPLPQKSMTPEQVREGGVVDS